MSVLGMIEFATIAAGIHASDAMVKAAPVEVLESHPIDPGKYITLVTGEVAAVEAAVRAGVTDAGDERVVESFVLANLHSQVLPALRGGGAVPERDAVGVLETSSSASIIEAADAACKAGEVRLLKLRIALHIGGKGYTTFVGAVADVEAAVDAGAIAAGTALLDRVVIPNPYEDIYEHWVKRDGTCQDHR